LKDKTVLTESGFDLLKEFTLGLSGNEIKNFIKDILLRQRNDPEKKNYDLKFLKFVLKNHKPCVTKKLMGKYVKFLESFGES